MLKLPEDSTYIHKRNMVNRYQIRPYEDIIYKLYASFLKQYQLEQKQIEKDSEMDELVEVC